MSKITVSGFMKFLIDTNKEPDCKNGELIYHTMGTSKEMNGIWKNIPIGKFVILATSLNSAMIMVEEYLNKHYQTSVFQFLVDEYGEIDTEEISIYDFMYVEFSHRYDLWIHQEEPTINLTNKIIIK